MYSKSMFMGLLSLSCYAGATAQTGAEAKVTISGKVSGDLQGDNKVYLQIGHEREDSSDVRDGRYSFTVPFSHPTYMIVFPHHYLTSSKGIRMNPLLVDQAGRYTVNLNGADAGSVPEVSGTKAASLFAEYQRLKAVAFAKAEQETSSSVAGEATGSTGAPLGASSDTVGGTAKPIPAQSAEKKDTAVKIRKATPARHIGESRPSDELGKKNLIALTEKFIREHPDSYASAFILNMEGQSLMETDKVKELYGVLSDSIKATPDGQGVLHHLQGIDNGRIGHSVSDFVLSDPSGKKIHLASFRGKYVLIDFWASWCGPCRKSFPHMRNMYKKYASPKFEMYSISIDKSKSAWLQAVKEENNPWPQALDDMDISVSGFAVSGVPTTILLDPDGKIVLMELGFNSDGPGEIEKKLAELFKK